MEVVPTAPEVATQKTAPGGVDRGEGVQQRFDIVVIGGGPGGYATALYASSAGLSVAVAPVGEFLKAGGGCRCLTLALDVQLSTVAGGAGEFGPGEFSVDQGLVHELP